MGREKTFNGSNRGFSQSIPVIGMSTAPLCSSCLCGSSLRSFGHVLLHPGADDDSPGHLAPFPTTPYGALTWSRFCPNFPSMKAPLRRLLLWGALPVLLVALAVWSWTLREPSWDGRSLGEWLKDLAPGRIKNRSAIAEQNAAAAQRAIQGMGTNCIPFLLRRIESQDPAPPEKMLIKLEERLEKEGINIPWTRTQHRIDVRVGEAAYAFEALGRQAAHIVPDLQRWLFSPDIKRVNAAGYLLGVIPPEGTSALIAASTNRTIPSRAAIAFALHCISTEQPEALTGLLGMADDPDPRVRMQVGQLVPLNPQEPAVIWPVLNRLLADPDGHVRRHVVNGLGSFKGDLRPAVPALTALATGPEPYISKEANKLLLKIKASSPAPPPAAPAPPP